VDTLILTGLDKVEEPELFLEIQARTGFASEFSHVSEGRSRLDLPAIFVISSVPHHKGKFLSVVFRSINAQGPSVAVAMLPSLLCP